MPSPWARAGPAHAIAATAASTSGANRRAPRARPLIRAKGSGDDRRVESLRGQLLIANPTLLEPTFHRTVVLVGEHTEEGALGVVLNRPAAASVEEAAPPLADLVGVGDPLFIGGPVQQDAAVVVAEFEHPDGAGLLVFDSVGFLLGHVE